MSPSSSTPRGKQGLDVAAWAALHAFAPLCMPLHCSASLCTSLNHFAPLCIALHPCMIPHPGPGLVPPSFKGRRAHLDSSPLCWIGLGVGWGGALGWRDAGPLACSTVQAGLILGLHACCTPAQTSQTNSRRCLCLLHHPSSQGAFCQVTALSKLAPFLPLFKPPPSPRLAGGFSKCRFSVGIYIH